MFQYIYHIIFILINPQYFTNIEQKNLLKTSFNESFSKKKYTQAIATFEKIEKISKLIEPELRIDASNAYFICKDTLKARINYEHLLNAHNPLQMSQALNQLGSLAVLHKDSAKALEFYRRALEVNNEMREARFNYELIKNLYKPKFTPPPPKESNKTNRNIQASDKKEEEFDQYKSKNISKERALQLLEDLKTSEMKIMMNKKNTQKKIEKNW